MGRGGASVAIPMVLPMSSTPTAHLPRLGPISGRRQAAHSTPASFSIQAWGPAAAIRPIITDRRWGSRSGGSHAVGDSCGGRIARVLRDVADGAGRYYVVAADDHRCCVGGSAKLLRRLRPANARCSQLLEGSSPASPLCRKSQCNLRVHHMVPRESSMGESLHTLAMPAPR